MSEVLVLAEDECIRVTCAEVLTRRGFRARGAPLRAPAPDDGFPNAIVAWEASANDVAEIRAAFGHVPVVVCTWAWREVWPEGVSPVRLPLDVERLTQLLHDTLRRAERAAAHG
jgi:hypothetical protein